MSQLSTKNLLLWLLFISGFAVLPSHVVHRYMGLDIKVLYAAYCILVAVYVLAARSFRLSTRTMFLVLATLITGAIGSLLAGVHSQLALALVLVANMLIVSSTWPHFFEHRFLSALLLFSSILVAGGALSVFYALAGGSPLGEFQLFERTVYIFPGTFTSTVTGNLIRPGGLFDEPGAFAMFVALSVALNDVFGVNKRWSFGLLLGSLFIGSFSMIFVLAAYVYFNVSKRYALIAALTMAAALLSTSVQEYFEVFYLDRLALENGRLQGDNRTHQVEYFFANLNWETTLVGQKAAGDLFGDYDQSSNPFSIWFAYGLAIWLPFFIFEAWMLYGMVFYGKSVRFACTTVFLLLLQRPYLYSMYIGLFVLFVAAAIYLRRNTRERAWQRKSPQLLSSSRAIS